MYFSVNFAAHVPRVLIFQLRNTATGWQGRLKLCHMTSLKPPPMNGTFGPALFKQPLYQLFVLSAIMVRAS